MLIFMISNADILTIYEFEIKTILFSLVHIIVFGSAIFR